MSFVVTALVFATLFVAAELLRAKPEQEQARDQQFRANTATQDRPVPIVFGTVRQKGPNITWYGDLQQRPITEEVKTGLFSSETIQKGFQYDVGVMFAISRGDDDYPVELREIFVGDDSVWTGSIVGEGTASIDEPDLFGGDDLGNGGVVGDVSWRPGTTTQTVNAYLHSTGELQVGGVTPRFTGTAHATLEQGYVGNSPSLKEWSFVVRRIPNGLGLGTPSVNSGNDANPMNVAHEILTGQEWGYHFPAADVDSANFIAAATTLIAEGNGFSMIVDKTMDAQALMDEIERQIDGVIYLDKRSGKWRVKLARADYDIDTIPQLTSPVKVHSYKPGSWEATTNSVIVSFKNRAIDYGDDTAPAQNLANYVLQGDGTVGGGRSVTSKVKYPGVADATLANQLAWRDLRTVSRPLIHTKVSVTREFWDVTDGSVIAWTDDRHEGLKVPFRIKTIDYGTPQRGEIVMEMVEDVFAYRVGGFADPPGTKWADPSEVPAAIAAGEQLAFEAPRAISARSPRGVQPTVWCSGRRPTFASRLQLFQRNASGTPSGDYSFAGHSYGFVLIGELLGSLAAGTAIPTTTIDVDPDPDTQATIEAVFTDSSDTVDVGTNLVNLVLIGDTPGTGEFALVMSASTSGGNVRLSDVYRGVLDTAQQTHAAGTKVWVVHAGGNVLSTAIPEDNECEIKLLPQSPFGVLAIGSATAITVSGPAGNGLDKRNRRPYPPGRISIGGSVYASSGSLEGNGSGAEDYGIDLDFIRRDYRTGDGANEIAALTTDAASIFADFPSANTTTVEVEVIDDPGGSPTSLFTDTGISATSHTPLRIEILAQTDGVLPTTLRVALIQRHDEGGDSGLASRHEATHDFTATSALTGQFNFGARAQAVASNTYTADAAGTHSFTLSSALPGGQDVEYQLNSDPWTTLIAGGGTSGSIVGVSVSDTIKVRHQGTASPLRKQLDMAAPGAGTDGYFVLVD